MKYSFCLAYHMPLITERRIFVVDCSRSSAYIVNNKPATLLVRSAHQGGCFFVWKGAR
jgi:hypothetical protein